MRKKIMIDLDDTINTLCRQWLDAYNKKYKDNLDIKDVVDWDWTKFVKPECGKDIYKFLAIPGFFKDLGIKPHAQEVIPFLQQYYDVYILSAAHYGVCGDKGLWLQNYLPTIPYQNIIFCTNKSVIQADYFIDDAPHNLEVVTGTPLMFNAPHNQGETRFPRFNDWLEIKEYFEKELIKEL